jgi:ribosome recycling factor
MKKLEKAKDISEDDCHRGQDDVQKLTDAFVAKADSKGSEKEAEIMEI